MSLDVVTKKIEVIARKPVIKEADIEEVITAAERSEKGRTDGVSNAEGRAVADLYLRTKNTPALPSKLPIPKLDDGAVSKLNAFFMAHNLPYGDNKGPMKDRIIAALATRGDLGEALPRPPRTGSLQPLRLSPKGEPQKDAYVDVVKKQFIVKLEGNFFGPFNLD